MSRLIDADAFKAYMRGALEQTRRCYPDGGEWAEAVTKEFCRDIDEQPTIQPERDIPIKPNEAIDTAWGIPNKQAVCPKCDYYLGHVAFLGDYKGKKVTYCETCGQAIDWEGWDFE